MNMTPERQIESLEDTVVSLKRDIKQVLVGIAIMLEDAHHIWHPDDIKYLLEKIEVSLQGAIEVADSIVEVDDSVPGEVEERG